MKAQAATEEQIESDYANRVAALLRWADESTAGKQSTTGPRERLAMGCFDITVEHTLAILVLRQQRLPGSAFALLRCANESLVRGMWLYHCATEKDVEAFSKKGPKREQRKLIEEVEAYLNSTSEVQSSALSKLHKDFWPRFNDFTHTGPQHVFRRFASEGTVARANYPHSEIMALLKFCTHFGMMAHQQLALLSGDTELALEMTHRYQDAFGKEQ